MQNHKKTVAVIGLGRFGGSVAKNLVQIGHEVIGLDSNPELVQHFSESLSHAFVVDATKEQNLREAVV